MFSSIHPSEAKLLLDQGEATMIDVRELFEYQQEQIHKAIHLALSSFSLTDYHSLPAPKNSRLIVYCKSGVRSSKVCLYLQESGIDYQIFNLEGGILNWKESGLAVVSGKQ